MFKSASFWLIVVFFFVLFFIFFFTPLFLSGQISYNMEEYKKSLLSLKPELEFPPLDVADYDKRMEVLANNPPPKVVAPKLDENGNEIPEPPIPAPIYLWPVKTVYPGDGAILPFKRIVAYYGNLYSKKMGALGEYPEEEMFAKLNAEVSKWKTADPGTPVVPALHYIAVVAQGSAGEDGKYRLRMPESEVNKVIGMAEKIGAIVFLDFQVAFSTLAAELPVYKKYFKMPNVHLGIDPEFSMKGSIRPGKVVGTYDAADINFAIELLSGIVKENNLPPKVLVVHRYTQKMVTNYSAIIPTPEVQMVMHMDGWGPKAKKIGTYKQFIYKEPVQFAGFKLFYKNDLWDPGTTLFTPEELLQLTPRPIYIQYQ